MAINTSTRMLSYPINCNLLMGVSASDLPESERSYFMAYRSHFGRGDMIACTRIASERSDPFLWVDSTPDVYRKVRQAYSWHEKLIERGDSSARNSAWEKFLQVERRNKSINKRLRAFAKDPSRLSQLIGIPWFVSNLRKRVKDYLGDLNEFTYRKIWELWKSGPGMTLSSVDAEKVSLPFKLLDEVTITRDAIPVWTDFLKGCTHSDWIDVSVTSDNRLKWSPRVNVVPGCRITFVPKTSVIERTIAIEPSANMFMQLAIHRYLCQRLKRFGLDLTDQSRNRGLALKGSLDGSLATIDLSSASDTVTLGLCELILPDVWLDLFVALRSPVGSFQHQDIVLEKMSSMGNGFTFVLESIIFFAIAMCCSEGHSDTSVYGDDIIVPSSSYSTLVRALRILGFKPNPKKSFATGPFRESCGLDAFSGVDVRPIFLRARKLTLLEIMALHNNFFVKGLFKYCKVLESAVPSSIRRYGPKGPYQGFFFTEDPSLIEGARRWSDRYHTYTYLAYKAKSRYGKVPVRYRLAASLFDGGRYSKGAPLRSVTKLVTYEVISL